MFDKTKDTPYFPGFQAYFVGRPNISRKESLKRKAEEIKATQTPTGVKPPLYYFNHAGTMRGLFTKNE